MVNEQPLVAAYERRLQSLDFYDGFAPLTHFCLVSNMEYDWQWER